VKFRERVRKKETARGYVYVGWGTILRQQNPHSPTFIISNTTLTQNINSY